MKQVDRPTQISSILETISSSGSGELSSELEIYMADLEAKQVGRPERIADILSKIGSQYPAEMRTALEAYVAGLESKQQVIALADTPLLPSHSLQAAKWSHQRRVDRELRRRLRALRKQNNYQ